MINYKELKRDFLIVNIISGLAVLIMAGVIVLQACDVLPSFPCGIHALFHIYCPGCGGTRAFKELLDGHFLLSLYYNPAVLLGAILIIYYEMGVIITLIKKNGKLYYDKKCRPVYVYLCILVLFSIIRDILLLGFGFDMIGDFLP